MSEGELFVKTLVPGLDEIIPGFPEGGLILVSGLPGVGKTIFGMTYIYYGAVEAQEPGVYVSTYESRERFLQLSRRLGLDFEKLMGAGLVEHVSVPATLEAGVAPLVGIVMDKVEELGAKRLVIDSFTVLKQALRDLGEARALLQSVVSRILEKLKCTTILIKEGEPLAGGPGFEEYIADAVIGLERTYMEDNPLRILEIMKLRGAEIRNPRTLYTITRKGFRVLPPTKRLKLQETPESAKPVEPPSWPPPDPPNAYTTGIPELDQAIGGYPRGSTVLLEIDPKITPLDCEAVFLPTAVSYLLKGRPLIGIPSGGVTIGFLKEVSKLYGVSEKDFLDLCSFFIEAGAPVEELPNVIKIDATVCESAAKIIMEFAKELIKKFGKPPFVGVGVDRVIRVCGEEEAIKALALAMEEVKYVKNIMVWIVKPTKPGIVERLAPIADIHLKITRKHGCILLYGIKPRTPLYAVQLDLERRPPLPELIPIV